MTLQLSLEVQCYDGASNMLGAKLGVDKRIPDIQLRAYPTDCHGYSLSLSVKDSTTNCKIISNTFNIKRMRETN